jgi:guanine deaminase
MGREGQSKSGISLTHQQLWWHHTAGAAKAMGLDGAVVNFLPCCKADFVMLNPIETPLLARKTEMAANLDELLFSMIVLGDDRLIKQTATSQAI